MKRSWIKLYVEMLDDPKLAALRESDCWRFVQLLLVAAERDEGGILPTSKLLAWRLRMDQAQLLDDLRAMSEVGIVCRQGEHWKVTNFEKRQAALSGAERVTQHRERKRNKGVTEDVTESYREPVADSSSASTSPSDSDSEGGEGAGEGGRLARQGSVWQAYEGNIGAITPLVAESLGDDERQYGTEWVCAAIQEAVKNEARNLKYVEAILARWKREGFKSAGRKASMARGGSRSGYKSSEEVHEMLETWLTENEG